MTKMTEITADNLEQVRSEMAANDQRDEMVVGCTTWAIAYVGNQRGQMTIWPNARGAVCHGGNSHWGDWDEGARVLVLDDGGAVDEWGDVVAD